MAEAVKGLSKWERDLHKALSPATIHQHFIDKYGDDVIGRVIESANTGVGPQNQPYPAYSPEYKKLKERKQGTAFGNWLRGISRTGTSGGMLDPNNFSWVIERGDLWLMWTAPDTKAGIYAEVHNKGLPIGRGGPVKRREFMHFETAMTNAAVRQAYEQAMDEIAAQFSAGRTP